MARVCARYVQRLPCRGLMPLPSASVPAALRPLFDKFPEFEPREEFHFDEHPHWFVGDMSRGKVKMKQKMKDVDVVLEVRDARAPFTTAQYELTDKEMLGSRVQRLVILNKADLVTPNVGLSAMHLLQDAGQPCLLTSAVNRKNLIKIKEFALDQCKSKYPRTLGVMLMVLGIPNVGKSTIINGLKRLAMASAKRQGPNSKLMHGVKRTMTKANKEPGFTREVGFFQISNQPRLYCYDTPGVMLMKKKNDPERNVKMGVLRAMPDYIAGSMYLADYLLFRCNREQNFKYVEELELPGPTDDIRYLSAHVAWLLNQKTRTSAQLQWTDVTRGAEYFLTLYREGALGKMCLDHIPKPDEIRQLRQLRMQTEPPGPWGPPCYPEIPKGLEMDRRGPELPFNFEPRRRRQQRDEGETQYLAPPSMRAQPFREDEEVWQDADAEVTWEPTRGRKTGRQRASRSGGDLSADEDTSFPVL
eukprot:TRINITY_DN62912_c0_g1_i1.p1 TRINITY_DN62912_c0_g1~~TRINITY_DN62912_c0_g1_i1.p1  ORF type:complete len:473 (-),score=86.05 TRINITY_DN62912_c0_g1_i1:152-1570(-)